MEGKKWKETDVLEKSTLHVSDEIGVRAVTPRDQIEREAVPPLYLIYTNKSFQ